MATMKTKRTKFRIILQVWNEDDIPHLSIPKEYRTTTLCYQDVDEETLTTILKESFKEILNGYVSGEKDEDD
jgi:hypothetical protein